MVILGILAMFLVTLSSCAFGNTPSKAKVVAKFLETIGRTDTAIGFAPHQNSVRKQAVRF